MRLAHISDLHLLDLEGLRPIDLLSKRVLGLANLLTGRRNTHSWLVAQELVRDLQAQAPDHVVVTGDLSNLSLPGEFRRAAELLAPLGDRLRLSVIPGNHDRYTLAAGRQREFERVFAPWLSSDLHGPGVGTNEQHPYPWVKLLGRVALVGLDSARPSPWFFATGALGAEQRDRLELLLQRPEVKERLAVVCVHHALRARPRDRFYAIRRLTDDRQLREILLRSGAAIVLHGHNHELQHELLPRPQPDRAPLAVYGATSSTMVLGPRTDQARYAIHTLDAQQGRVLASEWRRRDGQQLRWVGDR